MLISRFRWTLVLCVSLVLGSSATAQLRRTARPKVETDVVYTEVAGKKLFADIYRPSGDGPFPGVLVVHGGAWMSGDRKQLKAWATELCDRGYCAVAIDYRLAPDHKFPAQIDDCRAALIWMREQAEKLRIDTTRVGAIGYSAGGHLVSLLGTTGEAPSEANGQHDTRLQCVVAGGAPGDFRAIPERLGTLSYWLGGTRGEQPELYKKASPAAFATADDSPTFFFNGSKDWLVPYKSTAPLVEALKQAKVEVETLEVEGADHIRAAIQPQGRTAGYEFLDKHLKPQSAPQ